MVPLTRKRTTAFRLEDAIADPGFTPRLKDAPELIALLTAEDHAEAAERALARIGAAVLPVLEAAALRSDVSTRVGLVRVIGRLAVAGVAGAVGALTPLLEVPDRRVRRAVIVAL